MRYQNPGLEQIRKAVALTCGLTSSKLSASTQPRGALGQDVPRCAQVKQVHRTISRAPRNDFPVRRFAASEHLECNRDVPLITAFGVQPKRVYAAP